MRGGVSASEVALGQAHANLGGCRSGMAMQPRRLHAQMATQPRKLQWTAWSVISEVLLNRDCIRELHVPFARPTRDQAESALGSWMQKIQIGSVAHARRTAI